MIDILLINPVNTEVSPFTGKRNVPYLPYGLLYMAAYARENGFEVRIYDRNADDTDLISVLRKYNPKSVGVSCFTGPMIGDAIFVSKIVKKELGYVKVIWGGLHPTLFPEQVLRNPFVDFVAIGEGEMTLLEYLRHVHVPSRYDKIKGLGYKKDGKIKVNPPREFIASLDKLPYPAWDLVSIEKYFQTQFYGDRVLTLNTSRGCPHRCAFCYNQYVNKRRWRGKNALRVFEEITYMKSKFNVDGIFFFEDNFDANKRRLKGFCEIMVREKPDLKWHCSSRVDYANKDTLSLMKKAGCTFIEYGIESGSQRILNFLKKDTNISQIIQAYKICRQVGIMTSALFMIGLPTETLQDLNATLTLVRSLPAFCYVPSIFKPYPGTPLYDYCVNQRLLDISDTLEAWASISSLHSPALNLSEISPHTLRNIFTYFWIINRIKEIKVGVKVKNFRLLRKHIQEIVTPYALKSIIAQCLKKFCTTCHHH